VIERLRASVERIWTDHRAPAIAVSVIAVVAIVAASLLIVIGPGGTSPAGATPSATELAITSSSSPSSSDSSIPLFSPSETPAAAETPGELVYSDLDGVLAPSNLAHRLPLAVMISDNAIDRPQSGISSASIVYQVPMEGGEDRYMAVFQEGTASDIGGVRSARPFFVYWVAEYKALYAHVGGDPKVLNQVIPANANNFYNMDAINGGGCPYHRTTTRPAPHNDYTNSAALISCAANLHYPSTYQNLPTRTFRDDTPAGERPTSQVVSIPYHTGTVGYQYDPKTDTYLRIIDGKPEIDPANNSQVYARNVVVMYQAVSLDPQTDPGYNRILLGNVGSGKATLFIEGKTISATWNKTSNTALTRFYDSSGKEIPLVRGEIFMQVVPTGTTVTAK
jgi:hypothetical protein